MKPCAHTIDMAMSSPQGSTPQQGKRCIPLWCRYHLSRSCQPRKLHSRSSCCRLQDSICHLGKHCMKMSCRCQPLRSCLQRTARSRSTSCIQQGSMPQQDTGCRKTRFLLRLNTIRQDTNRRGQLIQFPRSIFQGHKACRYWHRLGHR